MWHQCSATVEENLAEKLGDWFTDQGALSVSMDDAADQPLFEPPPGATPLWQLTKVTGLFEGSCSVDHLESKARRAFGSGILEWSDSVLEDQVWERAWMAHFRPLQFGRRLWVCPSGFEPPEPSAVNVLLDPGLAFGTGTHPTTALCLEWLESKDLENQVLVDFGCGSGILAISALCLGASRAIAIDIDPQALTATFDNAQKNGVQDRLVCLSAGAVTPASAGVLVANILAGPLIELSDQIMACLAPSGLIALAGLLEHQAQEVRAAYEGRLEFEEDLCREGWVLLRGRKTAAVTSSGL